VDYVGGEPPPPVLVPVNYIVYREAGRLDEFDGDRGIEGVLGAAPEGLRGQEG